MHSILQDLRYALRQMRHAPGFAISVVAVLALGIGANAAMFTVLNGTLFRPLAYNRPGELVRVTAINQQGTPSWPFVADILAWRERAHSLNQIAYYYSAKAYLRSESAEQNVNSVHGSANLFATLGAGPALGRSFTEDEQQPGKGNVAVISDRVWRTQFHADAKIVGQTVRIDDTPTTVIGVMPRGFAFPADESGAQIWIPAAVTPNDVSRKWPAAMFQVVARRRRGSSQEAVATELNSIQKQLLLLYSDPITKLMAPGHIEPVDYRRSLNAKDQRTALLALFGAVVVLWLIACANVACLMLARTAARRREMAARRWARAAGGWCARRWPRAWCSVLQEERSAWRSRKSRCACSVIASPRSLAPICRCIRTRACFLP